MTPKGHKRGCRCVVCGRSTRRNHGYENQANTLFEKAAKNPKRVRRRNSAVRLNPVDMHAARELEVYVEGNTKFRPQLRAIYKNLLGKMKRGTYNQQLSVAAFKRVADAGAKAYFREFGDTDALGVEERKAAAKRLANSFYDGAKAGEFDHLLPAAARNPIGHYPRTKRGPKGAVRWYILDLYDGRDNRISSRFKKCAHAKCATEAAGLVGRKTGGKLIRKVELSGPYARKPTASTVRK